METTAATKRSARKDGRLNRRKMLSMVRSQIGRHTSRLSLEAFLQLDPEIPDVKLEWNQGRIELEYRMKPEERKIVANIIRVFNSISCYHQGDMLLPEADINLPSVETYRRPDASYLTKQQIEDPGNAPAAPAFLIEVISPSNTADEVEKKVNEYFKAGVQVVWIIYPRNQRVHVYTGSKAIQICSDADLCSAAPAVPELELTANAIFQ